MNSSYRVVAVVAGNSEAVTLYGLTPDTQYQLTVTAVFSGKKFRSRPIVFRTLGAFAFNNSLIEQYYSIAVLTEPPRSSPHLDSGTLPKNGSPVPSRTDEGTIPITFTDEYGNLAENATTRELPTVSCCTSCL